MSTVNKYNYEAVLLDFAEGRLSASETDALFDFLAAHPELQEDFDAALEMFTLQENESIVFAAKDKLLQDETFGGMQDLIIANVENVASTEENEALAALLENNKAAQQEFTVFSKMKLEADESVVFTRKEGLVQTQTVSFATWIYRASYAAAAVLLLFFAINTLNGGLEILGDALAKNKLPNFEVPKKPVLGNELIQELPGQNKLVEAKFNQGTTQSTLVDRQYADLDQIELIPLTDTRVIALRDAFEMGELAEIQETDYALPTNEVEYPSFIERVSNESNAFNVAYGFADTMTDKLKSAKNKFNENDYIELKFWKVHTQIRKPSWMKLNRR